jgi:hypothetical protein
MAPTTESKEGESKTGMPANDVEFLIACLKNTNGGAISVSPYLLLPTGSAQCLALCALLYEYDN